MNYSLFSSESVCAGHPDKVCDQISDAVLDEALRLDPNSRVAVETLVTVNKCILAGEVTCSQKIDFEAVARQKIKELRYTEAKLNFDDKCNIEILVHQQSPDIAVGVDHEGAGDQGMMFGYACNETKELMPMPIVLASKICQKMDELQDKYEWIRPDGKSQITVRYENNKPVEIVKVVVARPLNYQLIDNDRAEKVFLDEAVNVVLADYGFGAIEKSLVVFNGTGKWEIGGPSSDTGVTGRKIVVDTYGGMGRIGGGCFSGKDPTKVDRSGAYAARFIAKNIVAKGLADRCEVQLAYAIGQRDPVGKAIECFGTEKKEIKLIEEFAWGLIDLSVKGIISKLDLRRPIYQKTAQYGHFGHDENPWEKVV